MEPKRNDGDDPFRSLGNEMSTSPSFPRLPVVPGGAAKQLPFCFFRLGLLQNRFSCKKLTIRNILLYFHEKYEINNVTAEKKTN